MDKLTDIMERIFAGGAYLLLWGVFLIAGASLFAVSSLIGAAIFGSWITGVILGLVVTYGLGYILYKLGKHF